MAHLVGKVDSALSIFVSELRNVEAQGDSHRFRRNLSRVGAILAYEMSRELSYAPQLIKTPLGELDMALPDQSEIVVAAILRAGVPLQLGALEVFDRAESAFISCYRQYDEDGNFEIELDHLTSPPLEGKTLLLCDAMMATGASVVLAYQELCRRVGTPRHTHILSAIASREGVDYAERMLGSSDVTIWMAACDDALTAKAYIVPGLGDAGDLAFGEKG